MNDEPTTPASAASPGEPLSDARLDALMESCLVRLRRGGSISLSNYTEEHPELAQEIRQLLPALVFMEKVMKQGLAGSTDPAARRGAAGAEDALVRLGDYRIVREVGRGGMGIVYEAEEESLRRRVALKVLPFHARTDPRRLERFRREAQAAAKLEHPGIVPIYHVGEDGGVHFYVMQFIEGSSLNEVVGEVLRLKSSTGGGAEPAPPGNSITTSVALNLLSGGFEAVAPHKAAPAGREMRGAPPAALSVSFEPADYQRAVARVVEQAARALSYAHGRGVLHRDIKPSNLLLDARGQTWITDFGLAKADDSHDLTESGEVVGTLRYMAPERFKGISDERSDVYGLGVTLYELLALEPMVPEAAPGFLQAGRGDFLGPGPDHEPPRLGGAGPRFEPSLEAVVARAVARDPASRYPSAAEMAEDLGRFLRGDTAVVIAAWRHGRSRWGAPRRRWTALIAAAALVFALAGILAFATRSRWRTPTVRTLQVGSGPQAVLAADLDGDARVDLVSVDGLSHTLTLLWNGGGGDFSEVAAVKAGNLPRSAVAADLDRDGDLDLAVGHVFSQDVRILRNLGGRSFAPLSTVKVGAGIGFLTSGDLDGDGYAEILAVGGGKALWVIRNERGEAFSPAEEVEVQPAAHVVSAGDFDADGDADVVTLHNIEGAESVWLHESKEGELAPARGLGVKLPAQDAAAVDLDADEDLDLIGTGPALIWVLRNEGGAAFAPVETRAVGSWVQSTAPADFDGDGRLDVAVAGGTEDVWVLRQLDDGSFGEPHHLLAGRNPTRIVAADLDGDGRSDLAVSNFGTKENPDNTLTVFLNRGDGTFGEEARPQR